jgi:hypothetical protein
VKDPENMTLPELVEAFTSRWDIPDLDIIKELKRRLPQIEAAVELAAAVDRFWLIEDDSPVIPDGITDVDEALIAYRAAKEARRGDAN